MSDFKKANALFRAKAYREAIKYYETLAASQPEFHTYKDNLANAKTIYGKKIFAKSIRIYIIYHDEKKLKNEFPGYKKYLNKSVNNINFEFINLNKLPIPDYMRFPELSLDDNRAVYSEFLSILQLDDIKEEMIGIFTYSIPYKSRRYYNNDMNISQFEFEMLTEREYEIDKLYSVSYLPMIHIYAEQYNNFILNMLPALSTDQYQTDRYPYFSSVMMSTNNFHIAQTNLKEFFVKAKEKYGMNIGKESYDENTFKDNLNYRHNVGDYGGLLEKAFGFYISRLYSDNDKISLGDFLDCPNPSIVLGNFDLGLELTYPELISRLAKINALPRIDNDVLITYCTYGYINLTNNLISSLNDQGLGKKLIVICLCEYSFEYYKELKQPCLYLNIGKVPDRLLFYEDGWDMLMLGKMIAIKYFLDAGLNVIYLDGDIFVCKNFIDTLRFYSKNHLISYQIDENVYVEKNKYVDKEIRYCCGFCYIKSHPDTIKLYEFDNVNIETFGDDQTFTNKRIFDFAIPALPLPRKIFPNGHYWYMFSEEIKEEANLVHYNWDIPFFDSPKEQLMGYYKMFKGHEQATVNKKKNIFDDISRFHPPLFINKCFEGLGNKLISLANTIYLADKFGCKIVIDWDDGRYPYYSFTKYLYIDTSFSDDKNNRLKFYEDKFPFIGNDRSFFPAAWSSESINSNIFEITNAKLPESYMHKMLDRNDIDSINQFVGYDALDENAIGHELTYEKYEDLKYSFKGESLPIRADIKYLLSLNNEQFHNLFYKKNIVICDFNYDEHVKEYAKCIKVYGLLEKEINQLYHQFPKPVIGVHIRVTDFYHSKKYSDNIELLYNEYIKIIDRIGVKNIFIASDSQQAIDYFKNLDNLRVISLPFSRSTTGTPLHDVKHNKPDNDDNFRSAVLEMKLLSLCDYLIRPKWSSFSVFSEYWGNFADKVYHIK